ncbi:MAG: AraC family transcriptional regulator [Pseudomonadota bacterium]
MSRPTVAAGYVSALLDFAVSQGADEAALCKAADLTPDLLFDQDNRVPIDSYMALMRTAKVETDNPALALEYGAESDFQKFSVVGLISHASADMTEAFEQLNRYGKLVIEVEGLGDGPRFELVQRDGGLWMEDRRTHPNDFPELTETTWSRFICGSRRDFPQETFALEAHVTHDAPSHAAEYEKIWQVPVTFGGDRNAIGFNPDWVHVKIQPENRYVFGVLSDRADALLKALEGSKTLRGQVEGLLIPMLHTGDIGIKTISEKMGMSRQTLFRKLKAEDVTFAQVLDDLRREMAMNYLTGKKVSVNETAYLVGFSDPASFSRAFKRWTGINPRAARQNAITNGRAP